MKKVWLIPLILILLVVAVDAKCGDKFCDPNEDCTKCSTDCVCTRDKHDDPVNCTIEFTSQECEKGYCHDKWCSTLEGFTSIFQKSICSDNGSVSLEIRFQELDSVVLTPVEDLKVYMKLGDEATFEEIKGTWFNPSREGDFRYTKIRDISNFNSELGVFKTKGDYYVRVKYQVGRSSILFEDKKISCPEMPQVTPPVEEPVKEEPEEEVVEEPAEKPTEKLAEEAVEEKPKEEPKAEEKKEESKESNTLWYIVLGGVILALVIFFVKYELRIARRL